MTKLINVLLWLVFLLMASMCVTEMSRAGELFKLRYLDFEVGRYVGKNYDPYLNRRIPPDWPDDNSGLHRDETLSMTPRTRFDFDIWCVGYEEMCLYFNNQVTGKSTNYQYRYVSWWIDSGISFRAVDIFFQHLSAHCLECNPLDRPYYVNENWVGIRLNLYNNPRPGRGRN